MTKTELINRANTIAENSTTYDYCELKVVTKDWTTTDGSKNRTYFSIVERSKDSSVSKHYKEKKYGYIDNISGDYVPEKYGDLTANYSFNGSKF